MIITRGFGKNPITRGYGHIGFFTALAEHFKKFSKQGQAFLFDSKILKSVTRRSEFLQTIIFDSKFSQSLSNKSNVTQFVDIESPMDLEQVEIRS